MAKTNNIERIWPTLSNLSTYLESHTDHLQRYELTFDFIKGKNVADIACGVGYGTYLMSQYAESVIGFDISTDALEHAKANFKNEKTNFLQADLLLEKKYDVIVSFETIEHLSEADGDRFLEKIYTSLLDTGTLIISTPLNITDQRVNVTPYHLREYSHDEFLKKLTNNGFSISQWIGQSNCVSERLSKPIIPGLSLNKIISAGIHRIIPKFIRVKLARYILKNDSISENTSCKLNHNSLVGAFSQIAICRKNPIIL